MGAVIKWVCYLQIILPSIGSLRDDNVKLCWTGYTTFFSLALGARRGRALRKFCGRFVIFCDCIESQTIPGARLVPRPGRTRTKSLIEINSEQNTGGTANVESQMVQLGNLRPPYTRHRYLYQWFCAFGILHYLVLAPKFFSTLTVPCHCHKIQTIKLLDQYHDQDNELVDPDT